MLEISAWNQANALRQVTVQRGLDVRDFTLTTFGGSGSLLLCRLIDILGLRRVLVPPNPGNVSAFGLLTVDVRNDYVQTCVAQHDSLEVETVVRIIGRLTEQATDALAREGFAPQGQRFARTADLRYFGQAFEVRVPMPDGPLGRAELDQVAAAFHQAHRDLYGYSFAEDPEPAGGVGEPAGDRHRAHSQTAAGRISAGRRARRNRQPAGLLRRRRLPEHSAVRPNQAQSG